MLSIIRKYFPKSSAGPEKKLPDPDKRLVEIRLAGRRHTFYVPTSFVEQLRQTMEKPKTDSFFVFTSETNLTKFMINLDHAELVHLLDDAYEIDCNDAEGISVYLAGQKEPLELGVLDYQPDTWQPDTRFVKLGNYYFNRDDLVLVISKKEGGVASQAANLCK